MILIIQNGHVTPGITKYLTDTYVVVKSFETDVADIDLDLYSVIIILGGSQSLLEIDTHSYLLSVVKLIVRCFEIDKALIGICLGSQLISYALGLNIKKCQHMHIGYDVNIMGYKGIFRYHYDCIIENNLITVLEYFESMPYLFRYKNNIFAIQCHPDVDPEQVHNYTDNADIINYAQQNAADIDKNNKHIIDKLLLMTKN